MTKPASNIRTPKKGKVGKPEKLNPERQERIVDWLRRGNYPETAARAGGISKSTYHEWLLRGAREKAGKYFEFAEAVNDALAEAEGRFLEGVEDHGKDHWQAFAWLLERRFPERFVQRKQIEIKGDEALLRLPTFVMPEKPEKKGGD